MQMCNHVRDTLDNLLRVQEQGINQKLLPKAKNIFGTFLLSSWNIWGKTETYPVSLCLSSFRDLTLLETFHSRDESTLKEIFSLLVQHFLLKSILIISTHRKANKKKEEG